MRERIKEPIKLGIIGTGRIANRFIPEAQAVDGITVTGAYNPRLGRAEAFAVKHQLYFSTSNLESMFNKVEAIYIASPHDTHYGYIKDALQHGKHVLCEKPMVLTRVEAEELFALAKEKKLVLMEGIKTAYCPGFNQVLEMARNGKIGAIKDVEAAFTKLTEPTLRELTDVATGGSFLELASYTLLAVVKLLGSNYEELRFDSILADNGIDLYTKAYFKYKDGFATSKTGLGVKSEGKLVISGTKGYISVEAPWWKTQSFDICYEDGALNESYTAEFLGDGLTYEIREFASAIIANEQFEPKLTPAESISLAQIMEQFLGDKLSTVVKICGQREEV